MTNDLKKLESVFPFVCVAKYTTGEQIIGIVQNATKDFINIYVYNDLKTVEDKMEFLALGEQWWFDSNRLIPINIFLKQEFKKFKYCLRRIS